MIGLSRLLLVATGVMATGVVAGAADTQRERKIAVDEKRIADLTARIGGGLQRTETEHYVVLYDSGHIFAGSRARIAERTSKAFGEMFSALGCTMRPITTKLILVVFHDQDRYVKYAAQLNFDARKMDGFYTLEDDAVVLYDTQTDGDYRKLAEQIDEHQESIKKIRDQLRRIKSSRATVSVQLPGRPAQTMTKSQLARQLSRETRTLKTNERKLNRLAGQQNASKTRHEAAHQLAIHTGIQPRNRYNPFWVSEGLACQFEVRLSAAALKRNAFPRPRLEGFRIARNGKHFRSLQELITSTMSTSMSEDELLSLYSQAWGLFYYLRVNRPQQLASYLQALVDKPPVRAPSAAVRMKRFRTHFKEDFERIERDTLAFIDSLR